MWEKFTSTYNGDLMYRDMLKIVDFSVVSYEQNRAMKYLSFGINQILFIIWSLLKLSYLNVFPLDIRITKEWGGLLSLEWGDGEQALLKNFP